MVARAAHVDLYLAPHSQLVHRHWDWDGWLEGGGPDGAAHPERKDVFFVLYRQNNQIHIHRLSPFAALILQCLETPTSLAEVVSSVQASLPDPNSVDRGLLQEKIIDQLKQVYQAKIVMGRPKDPTESMEAITLGALV